MPCLGSQLSQSSLAHVLRLRGNILLAALVLALAFSALPACASPTSTVSGGVIQVVAGENFWGSIATQLGGAHVKVTSIVNDPNVDPHEYETSNTDARIFAQANYVILNGAGYDSWGQKLLDANPVNGRNVLTVAALLGKKSGDNPHFWYNPDYVEQVIKQITNDYQTLDPQDAQYFADQHTAFEKKLAPYHQLITAIKQKYAGVKVGSTESVLVYLSNALGLDLISPPAFMNAVSQGNDPPASAVVQFQQQLTQKQIAVLVYNVQTATLVTTNAKHLAADNGIPTVGFSETVVPPDTPFQDWQVMELTALQSALGTGH